MRKFAAWTAVLAAALAAPCAAEEKPKAPDYYPLRPGTKWHYRVTANGRVGEVMSHIAKVEKIDDQPLARLETVVGGKSVASEHLHADATGVFRHRVNGLESVPPLQLLRYPVKDGDRWESEFTVGEEKSKAVVAVGREAVEVPAGKYQAVTVRVEMESGGRKITTTYWFADGVGFVKQVLDLGAGQSVLELTKFERGK